MPRPNALRMYYAVRVGQGLAYSLIWTMMLYFQDQIVRISPVQMILLGTVAEIAIFLFEVPTGVIADVYSRRLSVILGHIVIGLGFLIQGIWPLHWVLTLGMVMWGIGETFLSGAFEAWITDELSSASPGTEAATVFVTGSQYQQFGALVGIWISAALALIHLSVPIIVGAALFLVLASWMILAMPERGFQRSGDQARSTWGHMAETFKAGFTAARSNRMVMLALLSIFLIGLASEAFDRLWNYHLTHAVELPKQLPAPIWLATLNCAALIASMVSLHYLRRKGLESNRKGIIAAIAGLNGALTLAVLGFAISGEFYVAAACYVLGRSMRRSAEPLMSAWVNLYAEPRFRATLLSFKGQAHGIGEMLGGPMLAAVAVASVSGALIGSAAISAVAALVAWFAWNQIQKGGHARIG